MYLHGVVKVSFSEKEVIAVDGKRVLIRDYSFHDNANNTHIVTCFMDDSVLADQDGIS
jgi:hypothetical protein